MKKEYTMLSFSGRLSGQPDIRQTKPDIRPDTGYKKGRISGATLFSFGNDGIFLCLACLSLIQSSTKYEPPIDYVATVP